MKESVRTVVGQGAATLDLHMQMGTIKVATSMSTVGQHRAPSRCPVCSDDLVVTTLGCPGCGTQLSGAFSTCAFCRLDDADLAALRVFLVSRGNLKEFQQHLGVSYPTARLRYAELLERLGLHEHAALAPDPDLGDPAQVMRDLAAGSLTVDEAEALLSDGRTS